ncbi:hypothetical protein BDV29DRAFT_194682 [Aspergillus leporis]|uniref:Uncharacterized protein n=1 Tax=Aspergillus leporis TaxID=41062 RepID=A0A5N5WRB2_9EURO|nr:hypothetical protein BDV29DRAFT_194682 [Aspergillus leporis]
MTLVNQLGFYALPPLECDNQFPTTLKIELGIVSCRLYLDFHEYSVTMQYLKMDSACATDAERLVNPARTGLPVDEPAEFADDPLGFLQEWLTVTRKGQEFGHTFVGYICQGRQLSKHHSIFTEWSTTNMPMTGKMPLLQIEYDNTSKDG